MPRHAVWHSAAAVVATVLATATAVHAASGCLPSAGCSAHIPKPAGNISAHGVPPNVHQQLSDLEALTANITAGLPVNDTTAFLMNVYRRAEALPALWANESAAYISMELSTLSFMATVHTFATDTAVALYYKYGNATTPAARAAVTTAYTAAVTELNATKTSLAGKQRSLYLSLNAFATGHVGFGDIERQVRAFAANCSSTLPADLKKLNATLMAAEYNEASCARHNTTCIQHWESVENTTRGDMAAVQDGLAWCRRQGAVAAKLLDLVSVLSSYVGSDLTAQVGFLSGGDKNVLGDLEMVSFAEGPITLALLKTAAEDARDNADSAYAFATSACRNLCV